jgi:hypothetical protein
MVLELEGMLLSSQLLESRSDLVDILFRQQKVPNDLADHLLGRIPGDLLARLVESNDLPILIEDHYQSTGVLDDGDGEVAFLAQCILSHPPLGNVLV